MVPHHHFIQLYVVYITLKLDVYKSMIFKRCNFIYILYGYCDLKIYNSRNVYIFYA